MAQQVLQRLVDDIDGTEASATIPFAIDGKDYEIDLSDEHAQQLHDTMAPYVAAARRAGGGRHARRAVASSGSRRDVSDMRTWLAEAGYPVKERGRIPKSWQADYEAKSPNPPEEEHSDAPASGPAGSTVPQARFQPAG